MRTENRTEKKRLFNEKADTLVVALKGMDVNTFEYQDTFAQLYTMVRPLAVAKVRSEKAEMDAKGLRMDMDDLMSKVVDKAIMDTVKYFKPEEQNNFPHLLIHKVKQLMTNEKKSLFFDNNMAFSGSNSYDTMLENGYDAEAEDTTSNVAEDDDILTRFAKEYPRAEILRQFYIYNTVQEATQSIARILGEDAPNNKVYQAIKNARKKFSQYCNENGYNIQY
ncbi:TPA: hypothetical protein KOX39_003458 [Clostridioides difficile]|nr:hypothetical protein [Clostridioides difficile]